FGEPIQRSVRVRTSHAFDKGADCIVVLGLVCIVNDSLLLDALFGNFQIQCDSPVGSRPRREHSNFQRIQSASRVSITYVREEFQSGMFGLYLQLAKSALRIG